MKFYISYGKGKPGTVFETFEADEYRDAFQYAAAHAYGWGFGIVSEASASYVIRIHGIPVFYTSRKNYAEDFASRILAVENEMQKKHNIFCNISISVEEC